MFRVKQFKTFGVKQRKGYEMDVKQGLQLISAGQKNYIATRDDNGLIIQQVVAIDSKLRPVGPELRGKVRGKG